MRHSGTQKIETARLLLRPLRPEDAPMMFENWTSDPAVTRWLRWEPHTSPAETRALLSAWAELYQNPDYYQWAMVEKASGQVFGTISLYRLSRLEMQPYLRPEDPRWEPGYCIGRAWWGRGYATEALRAVVRYWFDTLQGEDLGCCHAVGNPASGRVMEKAGFVYQRDGVYHKLDGTPVDCRCYLLTRHRCEEFYGCDTERDYFERII